MLFMAFCSFAIGQTTPDWGENHAGEYELSMAYALVVHIDDAYQETDQLEVAPYYGDKRVGEPVKLLQAPVQFGGKYVADGIISAVTGAQIKFKMYNYATEEFFGFSDNSIEFDEEETGDILNPSILNYTSVAEVNNVKYGNFQNAVNAASDGQTVKLNKDVADVDVTINKDIILDLGTKTLTDAYIKIAAEVTVKNGDIKNTTEPYPLVVNSGKLTVEDVDIEASKSDRAIWVREGGELVFNSGSILATKGEGNNTTNLIAAIYTNTNTDVTINGGTITVDTPENKAVGIFGNYTNANVTINGGKISTSGKNYSYAINVDGDITVTGGEIVTNEKGYGYSSGIRYGNNYALVTATGDVTISGGKITTNSYSGYIVSVGRSYNEQDQTVTITGGEFKNNLSEVEKTTGNHKAPVLVWDGSESATVEATISNGQNGTTPKFEGFNADLYRPGKDGPNSTLLVSGGTFDVAIEGKYIAPGFKLEQNTDGTYGVVVDPAYGMVAKIGDTYYATMAEAIAAIGAGDVVIEILNDAELDYGAREAYGTTETTSVTINGNGKTLTLNQTDSNWSSFGLANANAKVVFNNMTIEKTGYGDTSGAWNTHAIIFSSNVEMTDVTVNNSMAVQAGATLTNVTINEANGYYGLWINGNGQSVTMNGGEINATNGGRGIKVADEYVDNPAQVTLNVTGTKFNTAKKAAVLVSSTKGAKVTAEDCDITNVAEDNVNFVWVDEDWAAYYNEVKVYEDATKTQENEASFPIKVWYVNGEGVKSSIRAYYKTLDELFAAPATQVPGSNYIDLRGDVVAANKVNVSYSSNRVYTFGTEVTNGVTMTFNYADDWNNLPKFDLGANITMNIPYLYVIGGDIEIAGTINTNYLYLYGTGEGVTITETGVVNANTGGDKTVQVKGGTVLTVNGQLNTSTLNVWTQDDNNSKLIVSGANAEVNASHIHAWNGKDGVSSQEITVENGAKLTSTNLQADRGSIVNVDAATLTAGTFTLGYEGNVGTLNVTNNGVITNAVTINSVGSTVTGPEGMNVVVGTEDVLEGYMVVYKDGVYSIAQIVAAIGETMYASLQDAINAATEGQTVKVLKDIVITEKVTVAADKVVTLDLNGKTISQTKAQTTGYEMILNDGNLTIVDNTTEKLGKISYTDSGNGGQYVSNTITNRGTITVKSGTIENLSSQTVATNGYPYAIDSSIWGSAAEVNTNVEGGKVHGATYSAIRLRADSTTEAVNVTVTGGEIVGTIEVQNPNSAVAGKGTLKISGGKLSNSGTANVLFFFGSGASGENIVAEVTGGEFTGNITMSTGAYIGDGFNKNFITGGTFSIDVNDYCAPGYICVLNDNGTYGIIPGLMGDGTESNPYLIRNLEELIWFRDKVDECAQDGSTQFAGKYFKLTADIDLAGINWNPIGTMSGDHGSFKGVFDGGNHTIKNLNCQQAGNGLGLFARTAGNAEIKNLTLENVTVKSTDNSNYVGGLVGNSYASTKITNVHVKGTIDISGRGYIGGISGHGYVVMDNVSVIGTGTISSTFWCAGGILGYGGEGSTNIMNAHVEGITITSAAGGLGSIVGMAEDNNGTQPISGSNLSAKNVEIKTYVGAYGTAYANYALGYLYGGNETSKLSGTLTVENVDVTTSTGETATIVDAVAEKGENIYFLLQDAFNAGGDIKVIRNFTLPAIANVAADKVVTLDLNGFTISYSSDVAGDAMITNRGNLTITDNTTDKSGKIIYTYTGTPDTNYSKGNYTISNSGILTLNAGTVENATADMSHASYAIDNNSNNYEAILTINGGNVINTYNYAVRQIANKKNILNVNGGKIEGTRAVWIQLPGNNTAVAPEVELNVTDGTLTSTGESNDYKLAVYSYSYGNDMANVKLNISGGTFNGDIALTGGNNKTNIETLNILGGTFNGKYGEVYSYGDDAKAIQAITITGGVFATNGAEMYAEDNGYIFVLNDDGMYEAQPGAYVAQVVKQDNTIVKYTVLNDALAAAQAGETVEIFAGTFQNLNINKDITVVGERDDNNNNLVTFNGKLNITADGATAKNLNVNNGSSTAGYISAKNVLVEGCDVTGGNGFRYCYTAGTVTFRNSKITGATYGIHFDGSAGGNIVIENCDITGWTSFAGAITNVAITNTDFLNGNYNQLRFYQNAQMTNCTFNPNMTIDFDKDDVDAAFTDCSVTDGSPLSDVIYLGDIAEMGVDVTINQIPLIVEARVADDVDGNGADYYLTLEEAIANVTDNQFVKLYAAVAAEPMTITVSMTLDLNGFTITGTPTNSAAYAVITNRGNLTITDNTTEKLGKIICDHQLAGSTAYAVNTIVNSGTLTIEAGTIENKSTSSNQIGYAIDNNSTSYNSVVVIKGGKVTVSGTSSYYDGIRQFCNSMTTENSVTIAGGEVSSLWMQNPSDGTTRNANDVKGSFLIEGGRLTNLWIEPSASFTGSIIGGHVGNVGRFDENNTNDLENRRLTGFITGGTFGMDVNEYCHEHYDAVTTDNIIWTVEQVIFVMETALANGWNWFSAYVDIDGADGLASIKESLGTNGLMVKDGETGKYIQYTASAGTWNGTLTETSSVGMYMIKTSADIDEFIVEGSAKLDPSDEEMMMAISKGWNYIPYPLDVAQSITTALGFTPQDGDIIKGKGSTAVYVVGTNGQGWLDEFNMEPGQGYMYKSNATATMTFNYSYPTGGAKSSMLANVETIDYHWTVDAHKYANSMNMIAMVNVDGEMVKGGYEVAAFSNEGECRGTARPFYVEDMDAYLMILTIHGEEVENLTFRYYDIDTDTEYELNNVVTYSDNAIVGTIDNPYIFTMNILGIGENSIDNINIYPNPTTTDREINLNATFDKVEVYNALGVKVVECQNVDTIDALETAGIYVIRVTDNNGDVKHCRLVVK